MKMKNKKFVKPLVIILIIVAVIVAAVAGVSSYLGSRGVLPTMDDIVTTLKLLSKESLINWSYSSHQ